MSKSFLPALGVLLTLLSNVNAIPPQEAKTAKTKLIQKVYQVADLVIPVQPPDKADEPRKSPHTAQDQLISVVKATINPQSWDTAGGACSIEYFPLTCSMVVSAPAAMQEQVARLLAGLRWLQNQQIAVEVSLLHVSDKTYPQLLSDFGLSKPKEGCFLGSLEAQQLAALMEAAQGDRYTQVLQAPKITMLPGKPATVECRESETFTTGWTLVWKNESLALEPVQETIPLGLRLELGANLARDGSDVALDLTITQATLAATPVPVVPSVLMKEIQTPKLSTHKLAARFVVGDGMTAVLPGWNTAIEREERVPGLSELPYLGQLFRHPHYASGKVLVLVTPHILTCESEEPAPAATKIMCPGCKAAGACEESEAPASEMDALLARYHKACAAGKTETARKIAIKALKLDPTCFDKNR